VLELIAEAEAKGAGFDAACNCIGVSARTVTRWREDDAAGDKRKGPITKPRNALTDEERNQVIKVATSLEFRDLSPKQIVPRLADKGIYWASESTFYRVLAAAQMMTHREPSQPRKHHKPNEYIASAPGQVWTWDITYLRASVQGAFYYLYLILDIFSRKIVAAEVREVESSELAEGLVERACARENLDPTKLTLHSDNGSPMKGSTILATLQRLGIAASFSRPSVSNDNPYVESLFRTLKFRPGYPRQPFESVEHAQRWVDEFVVWYNEEHLHSSLRYVRPNDRHQGKDAAILKQRTKLYETARSKHPERWFGRSRNWSPIGNVTLNPAKAKGTSKTARGGWGSSPSEA
jgi:putative transposase